MTTEIWAPGEAPPEALEWGPVRLDRWRPDDLDDQYAAVDVSREHLGGFMPWSHGYERAGAEWFLGDSARSWADRTAFNYRVSDPTVGPDRVLGSAGLMSRRGPGTLEIGYWVRSDAVRRGLARRASAALTQAGFALPGVEEITICHDPLNEASGGIPAQLGYTRLPDLVPGPPGREDERHVCWSLRKEAWSPVRG
ncbi:GNAT family N-acetyltransferase [Sporichthya sp.]|uniref:GNAT family N-acetyltransferase n=1 Tax=Sporichthya sp. TaxID=65475 RepID=UPI0017941C75|nr:GNAT family N-acetyltransferase [Sporichthya sp.]MBA3744900.1 GNAT family N-acetyltransferase [Sporichthya sp.]